MGFLCSFAEAPIGRLRHHANELRERHCHDDPFVAVVLSGGYQEAGDEGRWNVRPGDVLIHHAFESHLDRFDHRGAEVLVLPVPQALSQSRTMRGRVADPGWARSERPEDRCHSVGPVRAVGAGAQ